MRLVQYTRSRSPGLAKYIDAVAQSPLAFDDSHPIEHSSHNHNHLWKPEYLSDTFSWVNGDYRPHHIITRSPDGQVLLFVQHEQRGLDLAMQVLPDNYTF